MTEQEIIDRQQRTGGSELLLMQVGSFVHAYGPGAFALARLMGYRVVRRQRKSLGEVLTTGFPVARMDLVARRIREAGGTLEQLDARTWQFGGLDTRPDEALVSSPSPRPATAPQPSTAAPPAAHWLMRELQAFDLANATPLEAMMFLSAMKKRIEEETEAGAAGAASHVPGADGHSETAPDIACRNPAGHGLQE